MKRALLLLLSLHLLVVSLLPGADARVLADVSAAREHHEEDHADESIWDFIHDHFLGGAHQHAGDNAHHPLPFHHGHGTDGVPTLFVALEVGWQAPAAYSVRAVTRPDRELQMPIGGIVRRCWQPPQA